MPTAAGLFPANPFAARIVPPERAAALDAGAPDLPNLHRDLAAAGFYGVAVPLPFGGDGAPFIDAVKALARLAGESLTAAFSAWCQRACIHYLLHSESTSLREDLLPGLLAGARAGATGLSNAMKHLAGLEDLRLMAEIGPGHVDLAGEVPWASNLLQPGFDLAVAARTPDGKVVVALVPSESEGVVRSADLPLLALLGSSTASVSLRRVRLAPERMLSFRGSEFLAAVRPGFILLQIGLGLGLAHRCLESAEPAIQRKARILAPRHAQAKAKLRSLWQDVEILEAQPSPVDRGALRRIFQARVEAMRLAQYAAGLELEAVGGAGYLGNSPTSRRLREAAFLTVVTPSLVQLETQLDASR